MTLENLLRIGKLKAHAASKIELVRLLAAAERAVADADVAGLSSDSAFRFRTVTKACVVEAQHAARPGMAFCMALL